MTVEHVEEESVACCWFTDGELLQHVFEASMLDLVSSSVDERQ